MSKQLIPTTCNRDCPDACAMLAEVQDGRVVALRGDRTHPVTQGFLCHRTQKFLERQYSPTRLLRPLLRQGNRQVEIGFDEAFDRAARKLLEVKAQSGAAAIFHYRSGGSLGMLKELNDYFFEQFGPVTVKSGDICSGAGDYAQTRDFGDEDGHDIQDVLNARHILNWGKNVFVSSVHWIPLLKQARAAGVDVTLIDPVRTRSVQLSDRYLAVRPGGDVALALAVGRRLFAEGAVDGSRCDHVAEFRRLCFEHSWEALLAEADLSADDVQHLASRLADGPTAILVGWGLQRRLRGATHVRLLDALSALSGNLGRAGGGVFFSTCRRRPFKLGFKGQRPAPRSFPEPLIGQCLLDAKDPPVRYLWVSCANPVAMLPDSATVARALEAVEFSVVVDAFHTDTTRRATLVLPTTTMLEDDDVMGSYGHHYLGVSRPVVPPPEGVLTDLEILQEIGRRVGMPEVLAGTAREWKQRLLKQPVEDLERGPVRHHETPAVLFSAGVPTVSGHVQLIDQLPPTPSEEPGYPLWLFSNSTDMAQSSQWVLSDEMPVLVATVHPDAAPGFEAGQRARLVSAIAAVEVELHFDTTQRRDVVLVPKGGHYDRGQSANTLIRARLTDGGEGAAYLDARVRIEK